MINLKGNHEQTMLDALSGDRAAGTDWLFQGGRPALESYGADPDGPRERWEDAVPAEHLRFLRRLAMSHREGGYLFVHAGIRPGVPLDAQAPEDLLRIRQPFLYTDQSFGAVVVHGHTPNDAQARPSHADQIRRFRLNLDAGSGLTGLAKMAVIRGDEAKVLTALGPTNRMLKEE